MALCCLTCRIVGGVSFLDQPIGENAVQEASVATVPVVLMQPVSMEGTIASTTACPGSFAQFFHLSLRQFPMRHFLSSLNESARRYGAH